jgi:integrase/recombinase XerD
MAQAKSLTPAELEHLLEFVSKRTYAMRNRLILAFGFHAGMRVGEISSLTIADVMNPDGRVKTEVRLSAEQTKGRHPRTVFLPQRLQTELQEY